MRVANASIAILVLFAACAKGPNGNSDEDEGPDPQNVTPVPSSPTGPMPESVRVIYLVPSDKQPKPAYERAFTSTFRTIQSYYRDQLGETFRLNPVEIVRTGHPSASYASDAQKPMWNKVIDEAYALTGARYNDDQYVWHLYIDAEHKCDDVLGAVSTLVVQPAFMLRGLANLPNFGPCPGQETTPQGERCAWVGGAAQKIAQSLGLGYTDCATQTCAGSELMTAGYRSYPQSTFTVTERDFLQGSPFLFEVQPAGPTPACNQDP